ncbi:MAG: hypothetical protein IH614_11310 [Desulfuromonadales bacterium]|nr:hypothetical protein [Desulfuromonadales bacterium]
MEETVSLDCPYCAQAIYKPLSWFKQTYFTCPECQKGLAAGQFATLVDDLEQALDAEVEVMLKGEPRSGCCKDKMSSSCCNRSSE